VQRMALSLSTRFRDGLSVHSLSENGLATIKHRRELQYQMLHVYNESSSR